jgi:hypothetical protein
MPIARSVPRCLRVWPDETVRKPGEHPQSCWELKMTKKPPKILLRFFLCSILGILGLLLAACEAKVGCHDPTEEWVQKYKCKTTVVQCDIELNDVDIGSISPDNGWYPDLFGWQDREFSNGRLYNDANLGVAHFERGRIGDHLLGSAVIKTNSNDWNNANQEFLTIVITTGVESVYLAYDNRMDPPDWLSGQYSKAGLAHISLTDPWVSSSTEKYHELGIWEKNNIDFNENVYKITIPGNSYHLENWETKIKEEQYPYPLMYVVIIKPTSIINCNRSPASQLVSGGYSASPVELVLGQLEEEALEECQKWLGDEGDKICKQSTCKAELVCENPMIGGWKLVPYLTSSVIEFKSSPVTITFDVNGPKSYHTEAAGSLDFEYEPFTTNAFQLNDMILKVSPFTTDIGNVDEIGISLLNPAQAECQDNPPTQPCTNYNISPNSYKVVISAKLGGNPVGWSAINPKAIDIKIDQQKQTFSYSGTLKASIMVNDQPTPMDVTFDLDGHFLNFAPVAKAKFEGPKVADCEKNFNKEQLILDASDSFDIFSPTMPQYEWYEDYGLATEYLWGTGPTLVIQPGSLGWGVHKFTLLVPDNIPNGVTAKDEFDVEVRDTLPPVFTQKPQDIITPIQPPGTKSMYVDIGQAVAFDRICSGTYAIVTNDAPENMIFPAGITTVTWRADDARGNVATALQKIKVRVMSYSTLVLGIVIPIGIVVLSIFVGSRLKRQRLP